ncbi:uncharacterized protein LOC111621493 [Centruroides sculpturatus]|uniref:uncharacterized protein LOC111621493 n=1 Tax=Centruroides sculpturatus TaxID=218467 RepID=UPI000C6CAE13|nr:uncharacterized protein LOC111621493 [Centruroides sculpturatus]
MDDQKTKTTDNSTRKQIISSQPTYFIVHATGQTPLSKCSHFLIQKLFESTVGNLKKIQKLRHSGDIEVTVTPHGSLNSSRGVISEIDLISEDESDIQISLSDQGVTAIRRISIRRDDKIFALSSLPLRSKSAALLQMPAVWTFTDILPRQKRMRTVWDEDHVSTECKSTPCCVNCRDAHPSYSRKCPAWQREKEVQRLKTINNISYTEARCMVTPSPPMKQKTFAVVLKSTKTCGVQTDISVSPSESLTCHAKCLLIPSAQLEEKENTKTKTFVTKMGVTTRNVGSKKASKNPLNKQSESSRL